MDGGGRSRDGKSHMYWVSQLMKTGFTTARKVYASPQKSTHAGKKVF
jgi:hypothetical protein